MAEMIAVIWYALVIVCLFVAGCSIAFGQPGDRRYEQPDVWLFFALCLLTLGIFISP